jgi:hypothetical protein
MLGLVLQMVGRMAAARQSPGIGMWVTVGGCLCLGHAGFAAKSCTQRSFTEIWGGHKVARAGLAFRWPVFGFWYWPHLETARCVVIRTHAWVREEFRTRVGHGDPRKQKSQQALTC